jgi:hypothetical protein
MSVSFYIELGRILSAVYYFDNGFEDWVPKVLDPEVTGAKRNTALRALLTVFRILICIVVDSH